MEARTNRWEIPRSAANVWVGRVTSFLSVERRVREDRKEPHAASIGILLPYLAHLEPRACRVALPAPASSRDSGPQGASCQAHRRDAPRQAFPDAYHLAFRVAFRLREHQERLQERDRGINADIHVLHSLARKDEMGPETRTKRSRV